MIRVRVASYKARMILVVFLICGGGLLVSTAAAASGREEVHLVPAVYVFGDSTVDVGNNQYLPGNSALQLPYGIDFPHSRPTGRFSNGYNVADCFGRKTAGFQAEPAGLPVADTTNEPSDHERLPRGQLRFRRIRHSRHHREHHHIDQANRVFRSHQVEDDGGEQRRQGLLSGRRAAVQVSLPHQRRRQRHVPVPDEEQDGERGAVLLRGPAVQLHAARPGAVQARGEAVRGHRRAAHRLRAVGEGLFSGRRFQVRRRRQRPRQGVQRRPQGADGQARGIVAGDEVLRRQLLQRGVLLHGAPGGRRVQGGGQRVLRWRPAQRADRVRA